VAKPGPRTTRKYSEEFKASAVRLSEMEGVAVQDVAIHPFMLSRWRKEAREGKLEVRAVEMEAGVASELEELRRVKKQYERLKVEHELLKKAIEFTSTRRETSSPSSKRMKGHTR
jgi:transposase